MAHRLSLNGLKGPDACLRELFGRIPNHIRITFVSAFVLGILTHMYMLTNKLTNHDDLSVLFGNDYGAASGRWFLPFATRLCGGFSMPWLIGLFSLLCLAGAACFTVSLLRIRRPLGCVLTAAVLVSFPTVAATLTYMFTAGAYFLALLLAAFGAWAAVRFGWRGSALALPALVLSLGSYQSYLPVAVVLMVGAMLLETLDGERSFSALMGKGLRLVGTLAAAVAVYMLIVRITTAQTGLVDYMGLQEMGQLKLAELPGLVKKSYTEYFSLFLKNERNFHFGFLPYAFGLSAAGALVLGVLVLVRRRLGPARTVLALVLAAVYPLAGGLIYVMVPNAPVHDLMTYGLCFILPVPLFMAEYAAEVFQDGTARLPLAAAGWLAALTVLLAACSYMIVDNNAYLKIDVSMRQCEAYSTRLLARIEDCEGYRPGMDVVLVGSEIREAALSPTPQFNSVQLIGVLDMGGFRTTYTYGYFLRYYCGFTDPVYLGNSAQGLAFAATEQVQAMPCYPQAGSVQVIDGSVVVKLNETQ